MNFSFVETQILVHVYRSQSLGLKTMLAVAAILAVGAAVVGGTTAAVVESKKEDKRNELRQARNELIRKKEERYKEEVLLEEAKIGWDYVVRGLLLLQCLQV